MILGLTLALGSALRTNLGFLFKQRAAVLARPIRLRHPGRGQGVPAEPVGLHQSGAVRVQGFASGGRGSSPRIAIQMRSGVSA